MITMPFINDELEPMGDNFEYGYYPDNRDFEEGVCAE